MSDALTRMTAYLIQAEPWKPDRSVSNGPSFKTTPKIAPKLIERNPALKARILTALQRGPATGLQIAHLVRGDYHSVNAKLSRLYRDGHIVREQTAVSAQTGRKVQVYRLRGHG